MTLAASLFLSPVQGGGYDLQSSSWPGAQIPEGPSPPLSSCVPAIVFRLPLAGCSPTQAGACIMRLKVPYMLPL